MILRDLDARLVEGTEVVDLQAVRVSGEPEPWWLATVQGSPEGGLSAFWWGVPRNASVPWEPNNAYGAHERGVVLEVAPLVPAGREALLERWALVGFVEPEPGGNLTLDHGILETPWSGRVDTLLGSTPVDEGLALAPGFVHMGVEEGSLVGFVLVAQTREPLEFGVAFRVMDHDPSSAEGTQPADAAEFLAARQGQPLAPVTVAGEGFAFAAFIESRVLVLPGQVQAVELRAGDVAVERTNPANRLTGGAYGVRATTAPAFSHGWGLAQAHYNGLGMGASTYSSRVVGYGGTSRETAGVYTELAPLLHHVPSSYGSLQASGMGEGRGELSVSLSVLMAGVPAWHQGTAVFQVEFGTPLLDLLGKPAAASIVAIDNPPCRIACHQGDDVVRLSPTGGALVLKGMAAASAGRST